MNNREALVRYFLAAIENVLEGRRKEMVILRYGLLNGRCPTFRQIGKLYGIGAARTTQLVHRALFKLRQQILSCQGSPDEPGAQFLHYLKQTVGPHNLKGTADRLRLLVAEVTVGTTARFDLSEFIIELLVTSEAGHWRGKRYDTLARRYGRKPYIPAVRYSYEESYSLAALFPRVARSWHPIKNGDLTPNKVRPRAEDMVWWLCRRGHEWQEAVKDRSRTGWCPYCHPAIQKKSQ